MGLIGRLFRHLDVYKRVNRVNRGNCVVDDGVDWVFGIKLAGQGRSFLGVVVCVVCVACMYRQFALANASTGLLTDPGRTKPLLFFFPFLPTLPRFGTHFTRTSHALSHPRVVIAAR